MGSLTFSCHWSFIKSQIWYHHGLWNVFQERTEDKKKVFQMAAGICALCFLCSVFTIANIVTLSLNLSQLGYKLLQRQWRTRPQTSETATSPARRHPSTPPLPDATAVSPTSSLPFTAATVSEPSPSRHPGLTWTQEPDLSGVQLWPYCPNADRTTHLAGLQCFHDLHELHERSLIWQRVKVYAKPSDLKRKKKQGLVEGHHDRSPSSPGL